MPDRMRTHLMFQVQSHQESNSANTEETSTPDNKPDNGNNSNTSDTTPATPTVPEHTHTWSPVTTRIHHNATGHYEDVVVETKPW